MERTKKHASLLETGNSTLESAARLAGCRPEEILSWRQRHDGGLSVILPSGRKQFFPVEDVEAARAALKGEPGPPAPRERRSS